MGKIRRSLSLKEIQTFRTGKIMKAAPFFKGTLLIWPLLLFLSVLFFYPLLRMAYLAFFKPGFTLENFIVIFQTSLYIDVLTNTLKISFLVTLVCLFMGYPLAYLMSEVSGKHLAWMIVLVLVPFWTSVLIRTYSWMVLLGYNGVLNNLLIKLGLISSPVPLMYNKIGVTVGMVHILLPFMILSLFSVMKGIDRELLKAAQNLGANYFQTFRRVFFPLSLPGVGAGCLLVFIMGIGFFITPALMGGRKDMMLSMLIDLQVTEFLNWGLGSALALILLSVIVIIFLISSRYLKLSQIWGMR